MNNFHIPMPIWLAAVGAAIGLIIVIEELRVVILLGLLGFLVGKVMESPDLRQKIKDFFTFE